MSSHAPLILASQSPRRQNLLKLLGIPFTVQPADVDESSLPDEDPIAYVTRIAKAKAAKVAQANPGHTVLAADTPVILGTSILQSPATREEARAMLQRESGQKVQVPTVVVLHRADGTVESELCENWVQMRPISADELEAYLDHEDEWLGISGAFRIQSLASVFITAIGGTPTGIIGLPLLHAANLLRRAGYPVLNTTL